jgi:hypothetical protein
MTELERALVELGRHLDVPPAPDLAGAVRSRLEPRPARRLVTRRRLVLAFALLVAAVGAAFAVPQARTAILEWLGLRGATVERVVVLPEVPVSFDLDLGERVTFEEASSRVAFRVLSPELLGAPDAVYVDESVPGGRVSFVYLHNTEVPIKTEEGIGLLLTEFRGDLTPALLGKLVASGTGVEKVTVLGEPGLWISGAVHVFFYRDPEGQVREETLRLAGDTLLWQRGRLLLRLESAVSKKQALEIARSTR